MKKSFWSKNCKDLTVGETLKFTIYLTAILYAVMGVVWKVCLSWEDICAFFRGLKGKIKSVFAKNEDEEEL